MIDNSNMIGIVYILSIVSHPFRLLYKTSLKIGLRKICECVIMKKVNYEESVIV